MELVSVAGEQQPSEDEFALTLHGCPKYVQAEFDICAVLPVVQCPITRVFAWSWWSLNRWATRSTVCRRGTGCLFWRGCAGWLAWLLFAPFLRFRVPFLGFLLSVLYRSTICWSGLADLAMNKSSKATHILLKFDTQSLAEAAQFVGHWVCPCFVFVLSLLVLVLLLTRLAIIDVGVAANRLPVRVHGFCQRLYILTCRGSGRLGLSQWSLK